jgi:tetratricopeptide (TPR) repeat protein
VTTIARALALLTVLAALPAAAAPIDDAKKAFAEGKAAFERGEYEAALSAYQRANMILPAPNLYYNIGATYERLGRYQEAALAFDKYFEMAGAPANDEDKEFQDKLHARAEADRKRPNQPPATAQQQQAVQPQPYPPGTQPGYRAPYYPQPQPYYMPPQGPSREDRLKNAKARRTRAIVLMGIGVPMSVVGIVVLGWSLADTNLSTGEEIGYAYLGASLGIVGITLWAPGAASYVKSSRDIKELSKPEAPLPTQQPVPPGARGF